MKMDQSVRYMCTTYHANYMLHVVCTYYILHIDILYICNIHTSYIYVYAILLVFFGFFVHVHVDMWPHVHTVHVHDSICSWNKLEIIHLQFRMLDFPVPALSKNQPPVHFSYHPFRKLPLLNYNLSWMFVLTLTMLILNAIYQFYG
jgi:hypothetical protein